MRDKVRTILKEWLQSKDDIVFTDDIAIEEVTDEIVEACRQECIIPVVSGLLPLDNEDALEPIQNALYATHAFSLDDCTGLSNGILSYLKEAGFAIVRGNDR